MSCPGLGSPRLEPGVQRDRDDEEGSGALSIVSCPGGRIRRGGGPEPTWGWGGSHFILQSEVTEA